jgi:SNF2 family DNA or RNA helicase
MFDQFTQLLNGVRNKPLELVFSMDLSDNGQHIVLVQKKSPNGQLSNIELQKILTYGYQEKALENNQQVIYTVCEADRQTVLALKSLNPEIHPNGTLVFDIEPPVIRYLRKKNIPETNKSEAVQIQDKPARPTANVSYEPAQGIKIETGYQIEGSEGLIYAQDLHTTRDGKYTRIGNLFVPLEKVNNQVKELLDRKITRVLPKDIPEFFLRDLVFIKKEFNAVLTDLVGQVHVITDPLEPVVNVTKDPQGWLDFNIVYNARGFVLPLGLISEAKKQQLNYIQLDDLTWVQFDPKGVDRIENQLKELDASLTESGYRLPVSEFASLDEFITDIGGRAALDHAYREFLDQLSGFQADPEFALSKGFEDHLARQNLHLRPYQRAGIHWLDWLRNNYLHGVLADDMGLGKTIQALAAMRVAYEETGSKQHCLVIAPKSVLFHWEREIQRIFSYMRTYIYHGTSRSQRYFQSTLPCIFITTYETVLKDQEILARIPFFYLILDEATRIKNPDAHRTQAIKSLNASHRLALSGTPIENRPAELWSLFDFLMRGHLGKHGTFVRVYEEGIMSGVKQATQGLGRRIKPFLMRRKKEDVAKDLPEKIIMREWVDLTEEQRNLYGGLQDEVKHIRSALQKGEQVSYTTSILPVLSKLKQICDHPALVTGVVDPIDGRSEKFDWIIEKIVEIVKNKEQLVLFSHFLNMLSLIESVLKKNGITYIRIDGSTNQRQPLIDLFNQGQASVALLSLMAAGYGINMTSANHVIHADRWWNPAVEDQATDRVHRIGQNRTVYVYHILTEGTLEEKIDSLLNKKRGIADQIIGAASEGDHRWTREELMELLKPLDK